MIWSFSWPLPAISRTSPASAAAGADRLAAVADLARARRAAMISARIVAASSVRGLSSVTITRSASSRRDRAHHRALALVAIAAAAEHDDKLALRIGPQRRQRLLERIRLVRIVDEDRRAARARPPAPAGPWRP